VVLLRWDSRLSEFRSMSAVGISPQQSAALKVRFGNGVLGKAAQTGQAVTVLEATAAAPEPLPQESFLTPPYLIFPLRVRSEIEGLLLFTKPQAGRLGAETLRMARLVANHLQVIMENLSLHENRQQMSQTLADRLALALNLKDPSGQAHAEQCRNLVRTLAQAMRLPDLLVRQIEYGALLHDLGKLGIDQALLSKSGPLTDAEYALVKKHPALGYQLLQDIEMFEGIAPIVLYHHEWVNGQGYPEGLAGEEIPLGARMVSIVDAWQTMLSDQPYRKALPRTNAIAELRQQAGTQFDPKLVDIFLHVIEDKHTGAKSAVAQPNA
jgi:HD-GYP domain-containing protein (c-di-GMP phosphodiesterase class II)